MFFDAFVGEVLTEKSIRGFKIEGELLNTVHLNVESRKKLQNIKKLNGIQNLIATSKLTLEDKSDNMW